MGREVVVVGPVHAAKPRWQSPRCAVSVRPDTGVFSSVTNWLRICSPMMQCVTLACRNFVTSCVNAWCRVSSNYASLVMRHTSRISALVTKSLMDGPLLIK